MQFFLYSLLWVLLVADAKGEYYNIDKAVQYEPEIRLAVPPNNTNARIFSSSSSGSSSSLFTNNALELSLGAFNSLFGSSNSADTISIGNLSYLTLGALILVPLIIGLALLFYLVGGSGAALLGTAFRRTDEDIFEERKLK